MARQNPLTALRDKITHQTAATEEKGAITPSVVRERWDLATKALRAEQHDYWLNHSFLLGHQWLWFNPATRRLDELPHDPERVMATVNRIWPSSRIIISKVMQRELTFEVPPNAADDATMRGASTAESILEDVRHTHQWESLREQAVWAAWKGGTSAIVVDWDPNAPGPTIPVPGESGEPESEVPAGDTKESVCSIADMAWEPGHKDPEHARWWIKAEVLPPGDVQATYDLSKVPVADAAAGMTPFQAKLLKAHADARGDDGVSPELTIVLTYYERPNRERPKGYICVVVGEEMAFKGDWPFPFTDHLNFGLMRETVIENRGSGETVMTMARPVQTAYNASWSAIIEHMKLAGNARLFVPASALAILSDLSDLPGEVIPYPDNLQPPEYKSPPQMPSWWIDQPVLLAKEMDDILGVHEVSRGTMPANIESGYGLSILAEQDSTPVGRLSKEIALAFGRVATMVLELYEEMVGETRQASIKVPGQPPETTEWSGRDLMGQTTAQVPLDAILPRSRAAMMATAEKLAAQGLITSIEQFTKVAELPGSRDLIEAMSPGVAKARRENHQMAVGRTPVPASFDPHDQHITEHNIFRMSDRYERMSPDQQAVVDLHVQGHETRAAEEMGRMRAKVAVDPMLGSVPDKDGTQTVQPGELPPGGGEPAGGPPVVPPGELPPEAELPPEEGAALPPSGPPAA